MKRFIAVFLALVVCLSLVFSFPVSRVSAEPLDDFLNFEFTTYPIDNILQVDSTIHSMYPQLDDYVLFDVATWTSGSGSRGFYYFPSSSFSNFELSGDKYYFVNDSGNRVLSSGYYVITDSKFNITSSLTSVASRELYVSQSGYTCLGHEYFPYFIKSLYYDDSGLVFTVSPEVSMDMNLNDVGGSITITAENSTDDAYDYIIFVSSSPSNIGTMNSLYNSTYISSSIQWCYTKQTDTTIPPDLKDSVKDKITDEFKTVDVLDMISPGNSIFYNIWGGTFKALDEYFSYHEDYITHYSKTQSNCPVYLINSGGAKQHTINFSSFNVNLNDTYYLNICYKKHDSNVVSSLGASASALLSAGNGQYDAPIFNTNDFRSYLSYDSIQFSIVDGYTNVIDKNDITGYQPLVYYSNPDNSVAHITNDNSVHINDSYNNNYVPGGDGSGSGSLNPSGTVINGVLVNGTAYFNYGNNNYPGVILPGGSSGSGSSAPSAPDFDFDTLKEGMGSFMDFLSWVGEHVPVVIVYLVSAGFAVAVYCRIWGR